MFREDFQSTCFLLKRFVARYWLACALLIGVSVLAGFFAALHPLVLAPAVQLIAQVPETSATQLGGLSLNNLGPTLLEVLRLNTESRLGIIVVVGLLYLLLASLLAGLSFAGYLLAMWLRTAISRDLAVDLQRHLLSLPLAFFHRQKTGDMVSRFTQDAEATAYSLNAVSRGVLQSVVTLAICLVLLFKTDVLLAVATFAVGLIHVIITRCLSRQVRENTLRQRAAIGGMTAVLQESLLGIRTTKSFAAEQMEVERLSREAEAVRGKTMRYVFFKHMEEPMRLVANALAIVCVLILSFLALDRGRLTVTGFAMFLALAHRTIDPMAQFSMNLLVLSRMLGCAHRVLEIFQTQSTVPDGHRDVADFTSRIDIRDVSYEYEPGRPALAGVDLAVAKGEVVALVGPSGGGKSTLTDLILHLCDPMSGRIMMDGVDIREFKQACYRRLFGVVPQECLLFNATIEENVVYGRPRDGKRLREAIELAVADDFINALPEGPRTVVGDRGVRLSGGQRQRIAIARAVYGSPKILILDEATSSLDSESERLVQQAIDRVIKGMTAIVVAHRLSTVLHADRIVVLKDGLVEAVGPHKELLNKDETYRVLYMTQFGCSFEDGSVRKALPE